MYLERRDQKESLYDRLQQDALKMVQDWCGHVWTDYNAHDPGITLLDVFNYGLLETDYRFGFPLPDYLATDRGIVDLERTGLFPASVLSAESIVTPVDYERLIARQVPEVVRCRMTLAGNGLYRIEVQSKDVTDKERLVRRIERLYHAHRNLGEDLGEVKLGAVQGPTPPEPASPFGPPELPEAASFIVEQMRHYPLRYDLPDCYGVNEYGADPADIGHQARVRQLRGYLLLFDRLLNTTLRQTQAIAGLLTLSDKAAGRTVPDFPDTEFWDGDVSVAEDSAFRDEQRAAYLDMLDTLYGENTRVLFSQVSADLPESNRKRARVIRQLVQLNAERFRSFDQLDTASTPAVRKIMTVLSGFRPGREMPLADLFGRFTLGGGADEFGFRERVPHTSGDFDLGTGAEGEPVEVIPAKGGLQELRRIWSKISLLRDSLAFEGFLAYGVNADRYRCMPDRGGYRLTFCYSEEIEEGRWIGLGHFTDKAKLTEAANLLRMAARKLRERSSSFYLLEHILLRPIDASPDPADSLRITFVLPWWLEPVRHRPVYEERLCERLPAHLIPDFLWLHLDDMISFEVCYFRWRRAIASQDESGRRRWAETLKRFISHHTRKQ